MLKNRLIFIEFKGLGKNQSVYGLNLADLTAKAIQIIYKVDSKLVESLYLFNKWIVSELELDQSKFKKNAIVVYNAHDNAPTARAQTMAAASGREWGKIERMHNRFKGRDKEGKPIFFDYVSVIPNHLFSDWVKNKAHES